MSSVSGRAALAGITRQRLTRPSNGVDRPRFTTLPACRAASRNACGRGRRSSPTAAWARCSPAPSRACAAPRRRTCARRRASSRFHASFIRAGAELIETNTFGANRRKLAAHFLEDELERINSTAVRLAREAREVSGADVFIAGSIGPLGEVERFDAEQSTLFAEQAQVLEGRGVDLLMLETFFDLDELVAAIDAVRSVSSLPIVALMTFDADGQTLGGVSAGDAADRLAGLGVAAAGANHSAGPAAALNALAAMQRDGLVLAALPNVGLASLAGSRVVFPHATPDYFAEFAAQARRLGAGIIGGCCGTTPAQITAIRDGDRRGARAGCAARRPRARARRRGNRDRRGDDAGADAARAGVRRLGPARPTARRQQQRADRGRAHAAESRGRRTSSTSTTTRAPAPG